MTQEDNKSPYTLNSPLLIFSSRKPSCESEEHLGESTLDEFLGNEPHVHGNTNNYDAEYVAARQSATRSKDGTQRKQGGEALSGSWRKKKKDRDPEVTPKRRGRPPKNPN